MDRSIVYPGANPRTEDFLRAQQRAMVGLGQLAQAVLGAPQVANGFALSPTTPASLNLNLGPGSVYQTENLEASAQSILPADSHIITKQGLLLDPYTITFTPPSTVGYSQSFLVQVQYQDVDDTPVVLQYYNSIDPKNPLFGPGGSGSAQNTRRAGIVAVQVKAGVSATTGTQAVPTPDAGWAGLWVVTLSYGQNSIGYGNWAPYNFAPTIAAPLPSIPGAVQAQAWTSCVDSGIANAVVIAPTPAITAYARGQSFEVQMAYAPTGAATVNVSGLGLKPIVKSGGTALSGGEWAAGDIRRLTFDGANFQIASAAGSGAGASSSAALLTQNLTMNVPTPQYPTIQAALLASGQYFISPNVYITIAIAAGYIENLNAATGPLYVTHPFGQRIKIVGAALNGAFPTASDIAGLTKSQCLALLQSRFRVVINAVGVDGVQIHSGGLNTFQNILIVLDSTAGHFGFKVGDWQNEVGAGKVGVQNVWVHGAGQNGFDAQFGAYVQAINLGSTWSAVDGIRSAHGCNIEVNFGNVLSMYSGGNGVYCANDGQFSIDSSSGTVDFAYNTKSGINCAACGKFNALPATGVRLNNNSQWGAYAFGQGLINLPAQTTFIANTSGSIYCGLASIATAVGASLSTCSPSPNSQGNQYSYIVN